MTIRFKGPPGSLSDSHSQKLAVGPEKLNSISADHLQKSDLNQGLIEWFFPSLQKRERKYAEKENEADGRESHGDQR